MPRTTRTTRKPRAKSPRPALQRFIEAARHVVVARATDAAQQVAAQVGQAQKVVSARVEEARARTTDTLGAVEQVFEQRVARTMKVLGVPSSREVQALAREVARLQDSVEQLRRRRARA